MFNLIQNKMKKFVFTDEVKLVMEPTIQFELPVSLCSLTYNGDATVKMLTVDCLTIDIAMSIGRSMKDFDAGCYVHAERYHNRIILLALDSNCIKVTREGYTHVISVCTPVNKGRVLCTKTNVEPESETED